MKKMLSIVGIGFPSLMSEMAVNTLKEAEVVVGYTKYVQEISHLLDASQHRFVTGMRREMERVGYAADRAAEGKKVCIVCSGDPTLYGMAALAYEMCEGRGIAICVVPSVTAAMAASSRLGAVLTEDPVLLSLSDQITPWEQIVKRIDAVNAGDFLCALYNPRSKERTRQLPYALDRFRKARGNLLVGMVKNAYREEEEVLTGDIDSFDVEKVDMSTVVLVGNTHTRLIDGKMVTPRGYVLR